MSNHQLTSLLIATAVINCVAIFIFDRYQVKHDAIEKDYALATQRLEMIESFMKERKANDDKIKHIRHDIKGQLSVIGLYIKRNELDKAVRYIESITNEVVKASVTYHTGNCVIDVIIDSKFKKAKKSNIVIHEHYGILQLGKISPEHLAKLLGCALDNAIEETEMVEDDNEIYITFDRCNDFLTIVIRNPTLLTNGNDIQFQKSSKYDPERDHGYGMKTIDEITSKYDGYFMHKYDHHHISLMLTLSLNKEVKDENI